MSSEHINKSQWCICGHYHSADQGILWQHSCGIMILYTYCVYCLYVYNKEYQ